MITATQQGAGWYVEGDRYRVLVNKYGITELYLKDTGVPAQDVLYGTGIVFHEAWGSESGTVRLNNADSSITLVEQNAVRVVLSVDGFFEPGTGGPQYGTGSARLVFYPDRFSIESQSEFTTALGSGMRMRPLVVNFLDGKAKPDYCFDTDGAGPFTWNEMSGGWAAAASDIAGPLSVETIHTVGTLPAGLLTVVMLPGDGLSSFDLWDSRSVGSYVAWRAQKTAATTGVRYRAVSVFNFATTMTPNQVDDAEAAAFRDDIARPDPLDGTANAGEFFAGAKVTTDAGDEDADGYSEEETAYVVRPSNQTGYAEFRFDDRRGTSTAAVFFRPAVKFVTYDPETKPEVYRWTGAAWELLAEGTDYSTTAEADEAETGLNVRLIQMLSDLSGQGASGPWFKLVEAYAEEPGQEDWELEVAGLPVDMASARVSLRRLSSSWCEGRTLEFAEAAGHTDGAFAEGDEVKLSYRSGVVYLGDIEERALVGAPGREEVIYRARGLRARCEGVTVTDPVTQRPRVVFNASEGDPEHDISRSGKTVGEIITWLFDAFAAALESAGAAEAGVVPYEAGDLSGLDAMPPKIVLSDLNFDEAIREVMSYEPEVVYTADPDTRKFRFRRLGGFTGRAVTYNGEDKPLSALVRPTLEGRASAYRIVGQGEHVTRAAYLSEGELEEFWGGRAVTAGAVSPGANVDIPVDSTLFFEPGDTIVVGEGSGEETTTVNSITSAPSIRADLTKSHDAATVITNKAHLESTWTVEKAFGSADSDSGEAESGTVDRITDSDMSWALDRWVGAEVTLHRGPLVCKRPVIDSDTDTLYVSPAFPYPPEAGDAYEVAKGVSRYRYVYSRYRISDADKRMVSFSVADPLSLPPLPGLALVSYKPRVWRKFPGGVWLVTPVVFDYASGVFTTVHPAADGNQGVEGAATAAPDVRFDHSYLGDACQARFPATGFTGTSYSEGGLERERIRYVEQFVTPGSTAQYAALAGKLLWPLKDIAWRGELWLGVVEPEWLDLGYRLNIEGLDREGAAVATGMEDIDALVAAVEIRFFESRMRLVLSDASGASMSGDWFGGLGETSWVYQEGGSSGSNPGASGGSTVGSGGGGTQTMTVTINDVSELTGGGGYIGSAVRSVTGGGANGIIEVDPTTGDVVVFHADYESGNLTPCGYAPRWQ